MHLSASPVLIFSRALLALQQGHGRLQMTNALNVNQSVGLYFQDWAKIEEGETIEYEVSLYEEADLDKVRNFFLFVCFSFVRSFFFSSFFTPSSRFVCVCFIH